MQLQYYSAIIEDILEKQKQITGTKYIQMWDRNVSRTIKFDPPVSCNL